MLQLQLLNLPNLGNMSQIRVLSAGEKKLLSTALIFT